MVRNLSLLRAGKRGTSQGTLEGGGGAPILVMKSGLSKMGARKRAIPLLSGQRGSQRAGIVGTGWRGGLHGGAER